MPKIMIEVPEYCNGCHFEDRYYCTCFEETLKPDDVEYDESFGKRIQIARCQSCKEAEVK